MCIVFAAMFWSLAAALQIYSAALLPLFTATIEIGLLNITDSTH